MKSFAKWILVYSCVLASAPFALAEQSAEQPASQPGTLRFQVGDRDVYLGGQYLDPSQVSNDGYLSAASSTKPIEFNEAQQACIQEQLATFSRYVNDTTDPRKLQFLKELRPNSLSVYLRDFTGNYKPEFKSPQAGLSAIKPSVLLDEKNHGLGFSINLLSVPSGKRPWLANSLRCQTISKEEIDRAVAFQIALRDSATGSYAELKSAATELFSKLGAVKPTEAAKADQDSTDCQLIQRGRDAVAKMAQSQPGSSGQAGPVK